MKCENCGKNEVSFVYRSSINGQNRRTPSLPATARKSWGYTQKLFKPAADPCGTASLAMMISSDDFFSPMPSLLGRMNRMLEEPFRRFLRRHARHRRSAGAGGQEQEKKDDLMSHEEQSRFSYLRQLNALKLEHEEGYPRGELRAGRPAAGRDPQAGGGPQGGQGVRKGQQGKRLTGAFKQNAHPRIKEVLNYE